MTAWHVVEGWKATVVTVDGIQVLEIIRIPDLDAAVLITAPHGRDPWPLSKRSPRSGEKVFKSGYGQGLHWWTEGLGTEDADRVAIAIFPGDSGGPVFDVDGNVLGVVVAVGMSRRGVVCHHCWIVPMSLILDAMPPGVLDVAPEPAPMPAGPLPAEETPWERFLRLKEERGV